ncbi:MAG: preprotein translocase subunit SecE [Bryobacteraceae bacterium]
MSEAVATTSKPAGFPAQVREYVDGLRDEMRLVTWPSWEQVRATTLVVIVAVFVFSAYFAVVDQIVGFAIGKLFTSFGK